MKVELFFKDDKRFSATNESGNEISIDMLSPDEKSAMSPMELLLSGLIACAAVDIVSMVKKRRRNFVDLKGSIEGERSDEHPRRFTKINLHYNIYSPDLTDEEAERIVNLATTKYCSVAASVSAEQTHSFEVIR